MCSSACGFCGACSDTWDDFDTDIQSDELTDPGCEFCGSLVCLGDCPQAFEAREDNRADEAYEATF